MTRTLTSVLCAVAALAFVTVDASASLASYSRAVTTGSAITLTAPTTLYLGARNSRNSSATRNHSTGFNIPFTFVFDAVEYTRVSVSTNGLISLGSGNVTTTGSNNLTSTSSTYGRFPRIAAWWDQLYVTGGATRYCSNRAPAIRYSIVGSAPNRILVVDFRDLEVASRTAAYSSWQVRFYEGTNAIEFYYANMSSTSCKYTSSTYSTSATIGLADASNDYISVTPNFSTASFSSTSVYNSNSLASTSRRIPSGTIYRFAPCTVALEGDPADGGTETMAAGDELLSNVEVQRGNSVTVRPFSIGNTTSGCGTRDFFVTITGPSASEYSVSGSSGSVDVGGTATPSITFAPMGNGVRRATLTVADDNGFRRSYSLAGVSLTRIGRLPNLAEGGTFSLADGDTLLRNQFVRRLQSDEMMPFAIMNVNSNASAPPAPVTFAIDSAGQISTQYQLVGSTSAMLGAGQSVTPVIRFSALGIGPQTARLTVNADGEVSTYTLTATSLAPAITVTSDGAPVDTANPVLHQVFACVGDVVTSIPVTITNSGTLPLVVDDIAFYATDTVIRQGPTLPLLRDARSRVVSMRDYVIGDAPGIIPVQTSTPVSLPFSVEPGAARIVHLTFVGQIPGKRFGRLHVRTNAENLESIDTNAFDGATVAPTATLGLFTTDVLGQSNGSRLAGTPDGARPGPVVFAPTKVGQTTLMSFTIANTGACDLRIDRNRLRIHSGDVHEFAIVSGPLHAAFDAATGDLVLPAGQSDTITVRFTPSRGGTRMATLLLQTNDSTIALPGLAARGSYRIDIAGVGQAGLDARELVLDPVVIGSSVSGEAVVENSQTVPVEVASISFVGDDAAEFAESNWPARPFAVMPGEKLSLGVTLTPTGQPGIRRTTLMLVTTANDTIRIPVRGEAGVQTLVVAPTTLFDAVTIPTGQTRRQTVKISNDGTLPVRITKIEITGADKDSYVAGTMPRRDLEAGQTEYLEVTYAPTTQGQTSAELVFTASNGQTYTVLLGGTALKSRVDPNDPTTTTLPGDDAPIVDSRRDRDTDAPTGRPTLR